MVKLESERLVMRSYKKSDLNDYHKLLSNKENMYYLIELTTNTLEESKKSLDDAIEFNKKGKARRFCIALKESDKLIGGIGYEVPTITPDGKIADPLGWFIMPEYQNKGYMTEAVKTVLEYAFLHDNCIRVATGCFKENIPTQKVMAKVGFRQEAEKPKAMWLDGQMRDRLEFAINRDEYAQSNGKPYYLSYDERYKKAYEAGMEKWGHTAADETLVSMITDWVNDNKLKGKRVIDFACGEGAGGEILSQLGCIYHGVDISPIAIEKAKAALEKYPNATVSVHDMVEHPISEKYDAAIDIMGLHMLVLNHHRSKYLKNAFNCLKKDAPMLFFRELYKEDATDEVVESFEQWLAITGEDYVTPKLKTVSHSGKSVEVNLTYLPARHMSKSGYEREMTEAGFVVEDFVEMEMNVQTPYSASIFVRK